MLEITYISFSNVPFDLFGVWLLRRSLRIRIGQSIKTVYQSLQTGELTQVTIAKSYIDSTQSYLIRARSIISWVRLWDALELEIADVLLLQSSNVTLCSLL